MRLTLAGKLVIFLVGLAALYGLYRVITSGPAARGLRPERGKPAMAQRPIDPPTAPVRLVIGYVGSPPPAALELGADRLLPNAALARETGLAVTLVAAPSAAAVLDNLEAGRVEAAVVDFPAVVFSARRGATGFHVILLVGWREGDDVVAVRSGRTWNPASPTWVDLSASGEYLAQSILASGRFDPSDVAAARRGLSRGQPDTLDGVDAAIGRRDRLPAAARRWPARVQTDETYPLMPDVLCVNGRWARENPAAVEGLARGWLAGQEEALQRTEAWRRFVDAEAARWNAPAADMEISLRPAPLSDQLAFNGQREGGTRYADLVTQQMRLLEPGPKPPDPGFAVPVDPEPLRKAAPLMVARQRTPREV